MAHFPADTTVHVLIDPVSKMWRRDVVFACLNRFEATQVMNIPLSMRLPDDRLIWHWVKDGTGKERGSG